MCIHFSVHANIKFVEPWQTKEIGFFNTITQDVKFISAVGNFQGFCQDGTYFFCICLNNVFARMITFKQEMFISVKLLSNIDLGLNFDNNPYNQKVLCCVEVSGYTCYQKLFSYYLHNTFINNFIKRYFTWLPLSRNI